MIVADSNGRQMKWTQSDWGHIDWSNTVHREIESKTRCDCCFCWVQRCCKTGEEERQSTCCCGRWSSFSRFFAICSAGSQNLRNVSWQRETSFVYTKVMAQKNVIDMAVNNDAGGWMSGWMYKWMSVCRMMQAQQKQTRWWRWKMNKRPDDQLKNWTDTKLSNSRLASCNL